MLTFVRKGSPHLRESHGDSHAILLARVVIVLTHAGNLAGQDEVFVWWCWFQILNLRSQEIS